MEHLDRHFYINMDKFIQLSIGFLCISVLATVSSQQICQNKACLCQGDQVVCQCNKNIQDISINSIKLLPHVCNLVEIVGCRNVIIGSADGSELSFQWLQIRNVRNFQIVPGSTVSFANITLSNISNVDIASNSLRSGNIHQRIQFDRANFTTIESNTFRDTLNLEYLYFDKCHIKKMSSLAVNDPFTSSSTLSQFHMANCVVDNMEENAIRINSKIVTIMANQFHGGLKRSSLYLRVHDFGFLNNQVGLIEESGFDVECTGHVRIENNIINRTKAEAFRKIRYSSLNPRTSDPVILIIENNTIIQLEDIPFIVDVESFAYDNRADCKHCRIQHNQLPCSCDTLKLYENQSILYSARPEASLIHQVLSSHCLDDNQLNPRQIINSPSLRKKHCTSAGISFTMMNNLLPVFLWTCFAYYLLI